VVEAPTVGIIKFECDKLVHEHIYWDQASVLVQVGLLDPAGSWMQAPQSTHRS
jgi:carboxymethylenebutenolidase